MTEPNDPFDAWLHRQVEPLRPPPGTFQQIRKRARRRKTRRALMSAASAGAAAALIVVAVVALPRLVPSLHLRSHPVGNPAADGGPSRSHTPTAPASTAPSTAANGVAANFAPSSVTFVSQSTGFVIGQSSACAPYCTAMAETTDGGHSWFGVGAPPTGAPDGGTGVSQVRFLDPSNGWAFGPQLYVTHDGGQTWKQIGTNGLRVTDLETVGGMAYAVFAQCSGTGADYASDCTHVSLYSSAYNSDTFAPAGLQGLGLNAGYVSGKILIAHGQGFFYAPDGLLYGGSTSGAGTWQPVSSTAAPCVPPGGEVDGQSPGGQIAASTPGDLALACPVGTSDQQTIYTSVTGGQIWAKEATVTINGTVTSLTAMGGMLALATTEGIYVSTNDGQGWTLAEEGPVGGFSYVGMTNTMQGVAVPAEPSSSDSVWFTYNGGQSWQQSSIDS
jgi:photosystem II stability/assembly factor-like uncharacterized protein